MTAHKSDQVCFFLSLVVVPVQGPGGKLRIVVVVFGTWWLVLAARNENGANSQPACLPACLPVKVAAFHLFEQHKQVLYQHCMYVCS
jgi:hypothetical protein